MRLKRAPPEEILLQNLSCFSGSSLEAHPPPPPGAMTPESAAAPLSAGTAASLFQNCSKKSKCFMGGNRFLGAVVVSKKTLPDILIILSGNACIVGPGPTHCVYQALDFNKIEPAGCTNNTRELCGEAFMGSRQ